MVHPSAWLHAQKTGMSSHPQPPGPHPGMHPSTSRYLVATGAYPPHHHASAGPMYAHSSPPGGVGIPRPPSSASTASTASFHTAQQQQLLQQQQPTDAGSISSRGTPTGSVATAPSVSTEKTGSTPPPPPPPGHPQPPPPPSGPPQQQQQQHTMPYPSHLPPPPPPPHGYPIPPRSNGGGGPIRPVARGYYGGGRPRHPNIMLRVQNPMAAMIEEQAFARGKYAAHAESAAGYYSHHPMQRGGGGGGQHHAHPHHVSSMGAGHSYQHHHHRGGAGPHHGRTFPPVHGGQPQATSPYLLPRPSPETVNSIQSMGSAPSPPPVPPSQQQQPTEDGNVDPSATSSKTMPPIVPLQDRSAAIAAGDNSNFNPPPGKKGPANHSDAASILMQLGCGSVEKTGVADDASAATTDLLAPTSSMVESNTHDCAPDLTSEPSSDSADNNKEQETATATPATSSFPTLVASEFPCPVPVAYPTRLSLPFDENKLNSNHCYLRSELLEIFVVQKSQHKSPTHSPGSSVGRVGLRCVHCANIGRDRGVDRSEAPMAVFYPKSISEIYRLVTSWQRCHLRKCKNVPPSIRKEWNSLRESDKSRGKVHYWMTSAMQIGLMDCNSRAGGIRFSPQMCEEAKHKQQREQEQAEGNATTITVAADVVV